MALIERYQELGIASILAHRATIDPQRTFLLHDSRRVTFGELDQEAEALAAAFHNLGIEAGDRIALILPSCPEFVASMMAAAKLGATIVPLDPLLTEAELQYMLRHSEAVAAVTIETFRGVQYLEMFEDILLQLPDLRYLVTVGEEDLWYDDRIFQYEDMVSAGKGRDFPSRPQGELDDVFAILYTSGTTGKPKGVMVTDRNLVIASGGTAERLGLTQEDRVAGGRDADSCVRSWPRGGRLASGRVFAGAGPRSRFRAGPGPDRSPSGDRGIRNAHASGHAGEGAGTECP